MTERKYDLSHLTDEELSAVRRAVERLEVDRGITPAPSGKTTVFAFVAEFNRYRFTGKERIEAMKNGARLGDVGDPRKIYVHLPIDHPAIQDVNSVVGAGYLRRSARRAAKAAARSALIRSEDPGAAARQALDAWKPRQPWGGIGWLLGAAGAVVLGITFGSGWVFDDNGMILPGMQSWGGAAVATAMALIVLGFVFVALSHFDDTPYTV